MPRGGTIIGTTRTNPYKVEGGVEGIKRSFAELDALVAIGGEDTLGVASRLYDELGAPVVGVPKTIDNDLSGTDYTFGFDTAVAICTEAIDRLHTTAESHNRVMVVEVMGRHAGWIAVHSGIAGGADVILIPERPVDFDEVTRELQRRHSRGKNFRSSSSAKGASCPAQRIRARSTSSATSCSRSAESATGSARRSRAGPASRARHRARPRQRGRSTDRLRPHPRDPLRVRPDLVAAGELGQMASLRGSDVVSVSLREATAELKTVTDDWYNVARAFFG